MSDENTALMEVPVQNVGIQMTPEFASQLALAISKIHPLSLDGTNAFHKYDYPTVAQVRGNAGQALAQAGIGIIPEIQKCMRDSRVTGKGGTTNVTVVQLRMHLFSAKGSISVNWVGESEDLTDKGTAKAISAGVKSFLIAFLMMPFEEEENDDGRTDSELNKKRAKSQADDVVAIVEEARKLGVTFSVEGDNLRPVNGQKLTKELSKKVAGNSARIVEYIKSSSIQVTPSPNVELKDVPEIPYDSETESSKKQSDEPPAVSEGATSPKARKVSTTCGTPTQPTGKQDDGMEWCEWCGEHPSAKGVPCDSCKKLGANPEDKKQVTEKSSGNTPSSQRNTNGNSKVQRPLSPTALRDFIARKAESINKLGTKVTDRDRQQLAAAMDSAFTDKSATDREVKRHRDCKYLTGFASLSSKAEFKMPDWYVGALKAWMSFGVGTVYKDGKYLLADYLVAEINAVEHEALMQEGGMPVLSPAADFAAECLTTNHTEEEVKKWLEGNGWDILNDWPKCEPSAREFIVIARTQGVDLLTDETIREMVLARGTELWPVV